MSAQENLPLRHPGARVLDKAYQVQRARECTSFGNSLLECATAAGLDFDKQVTAELGFDKGQHSRWKNNSEGIIEPRFRQLLAHCGNHIPVFYIVESLGYDAASLRIAETPLERENRELRDQIAAYRKLIGLQVVT